MKQKKDPLKTIEFGGINFKVIDRQEAYQLLGQLTDFNDEEIYDVFEDDWRFPCYEGTNVFLLIEDDHVELDAFDMEYSTDEHTDIFILGFIFKGNLTVKKTISSYDSDNSPALVVFGKTTAFNIYLSGNVHYLGGGLWCDSIVGQYNHGELFVKGDTHAGLIYSDDMCMHFENFTAVQAIINTNRPDILICSQLYNKNNEIVTIENFMPSTHKLSDIVRDEALEENKFVYADEEHQLIDDFRIIFFEEGLSLIDHDKSKLYNYESFRIDFIDIVKILSELEEVKEAGSIYTEYESQQYEFCHFTHKNCHYSQLSTTIDNGFNIRTRTLLQRDT